MNADLLTVIVPVDLVRRPAQLRRRTLSLVRSLVEISCRVVVVHNDRGTAADRSLCQAFESLPRRWVQLLSHAFNDGLPNNALLRNQGYREVGTPYLMLLDADILASAALVNALLVQALAHPSGTAMAPCLYLSPSGSLRALIGADRSRFWREYLAHDRRHSLHLAMPSSVMVLKTADFGAIGGFAEAYTGHGFEDFDFMVRLAEATQAIDLTGVQNLGEAYRAPLLATGFRATLSTWCFDALISGAIALHLHHSRDADDAYYQSRQANADRFRDRLATLAPSTSEVHAVQPPFALASALYRYCTDRRLNPSAFEALLSARPSFLDRGGVLKRALLRIASRPIQRAVEDGFPACVGWPRRLDSPSRPSLQSSIHTP